MAFEVLQNAEREVHDSGLDQLLVIDADVHHLTVIPFLGPFLEARWRRAVETTAGGLMPSNIGHRMVGSRIKRSFTEGDWPSLKDRDHPPRQILKLVAELTGMGIDYSVVFPNDLLHLGAHPQPDFEVAIATAYARWMTDQVLDFEPRIWSMLYLPFCDPDASLRIIEEFGHRKGVVGFLVTGQRTERIHHNRWTPVYAALEERDLALGFHSSGYWPERPYNLFDTFLSAHALSFPFYNAIQMVNLILGGVVERFPSLRVIFFEAGAAILPTLMARLDTAFMMRPSEAPLLSRPPSEYMKDFFYTIQPVENPERIGQLKAIFDTIGRSQILYASDYPHWDCDMPSSINNLGFLSPEDRAGIFHRNALRAFNLPAADLSLTNWKKSKASNPNPTRPTSR